MTEAAVSSLTLPAIVRATEPFIPGAWPKVIHVPERKVLHPRFDDHIAKFTKEDLDYFEALCFLRADKIARPYSALMRAPAMNHKETCAALAKQAIELAGAEAEAARKSDPVRAGEILAYTIAALCEAPGCIPRGIEVDGPGFGDGADINIGHERGRPLSNYHTAAHAHLYVFNSFNFFEDVLGPHSSIQFANDHLTEMGIEFALRLWPERIEEMRKREGALGL
jgi:hypothetical protein